MPTHSRILSLIAAAAYLLTILVNYLANALPLNGVTTGQASDSYANLFTPAGVTFSIWGVIYTLLLVHLIYQFSSRNHTAGIRNLIRKTNPWFIATSVLNTAWIFAWHYDQILLSVFIMTGLLVSLIRLVDIQRLHSGSSEQKLSSGHKHPPVQKLTLWEELCLRLPFSIYFGWITVATIANITVLLVSLQWDGFGLSPVFWMVTILLVGTVIGVATMIRNRDLAYGLVLVWAYGGIWLQHTSPEGWNNQYPAVIVTVLICIAAFLIVGAGTGLVQLRSRRRV